MIQKLALLLLPAFVACTGPDEAVLVGEWSVNENISNQTYELEFRDDGSLRQIVRGELNKGQYELDDVDGHYLLNITWSNGSRHTGWIVVNSDGSLTHYPYNGGRPPDFGADFKLADMTRM